MLWLCRSFIDSKRTDESGGRTKQYLRAKGDSMNQLYRICLLTVGSDGEYELAAVRFPCRSYKPDHLNKKKGYQSYGNVYIRNKFITHHGP